MVLRQLSVQLVLIIVCAVTIQERQLPSVPASEPSAPAVAQMDMVDEMDSVDEADEVMIDDADTPETVTSSAKTTPKPQPEAPDPLGGYSPFFNPHDLPIEEY